MMNETPPHSHCYSMFLTADAIERCVVCSPLICVKSHTRRCDSPQAMVETVNNLLQPRAQTAWRELSTSEQLHSATLLLDTVETGAFMLADNLLKTDTVQETTDNIRECPAHPFP